MQLITLPAVTWDFGNYVTKILCNVIYASSSKINMLYSWSVKSRSCRPDKFCRRLGEGEIAADHIGGHFDASNFTKGW